MIVFFFFFFKCAPWSDTFWKHFVFYLQFICILKFFLGRCCISTPLWGKNSLSHALLPWFLASRKFPLATALPPCAWWTVQLVAPSDPLPLLFKSLESDLALWLVAELTQSKFQALSWGRSGSFHVCTLWEARGRVRSLAALGPPWVARKPHQPREEDTWTRPKEPSQEQVILFSPQPLSTRAVRQRWAACPCAHWRQISNCCSSPLFGAGLFAHDRHSRQYVFHLAWWGPVQSSWGFSSFSLSFPLGSPLLSWQPHPPACLSEVKPPPTSSQYATIIILKTIRVSW